MSIKKWFLLAVLTAFSLGVQADNFSTSPHQDGTPPQITAGPVATNSQGQIRIGWQTNEVADSRVLYGTQADALTQVGGDIEFTLAHDVVLGGLEPATVYYYQVQSHNPMGHGTASTVLSFASPASRRLTLQFSGSGSVLGPNLDCGSDCTVDYPEGTPLTLTAYAPTGSGQIFSGWTGACSGTSSTCTVTMDSAQSVTATFSETLSSGQSVSGLSGLAGSDQSFAIEVPGGATTLTIRIAGGVGEVALYVRFGALATSTEYDCYQSGDAAELICVIENPQAGTYFVTLVGVTDFSGVSLQASDATQQAYACSADEQLTLTFGPSPGELLEVQGCWTITVEAGATVSGTSQLVLGASERIRFRPGFRVESGGRLAAAMSAGALSASTMSSDDESETTVLMVASTDEPFASTESSGTPPVQSVDRDGSDSAATGTLDASSLEESLMAATLEFASLCAEPPAELAAVAGDQSVKLTWSAAPEGGGYQAYWSLTPGIHPYTAASYLGFAEVEDALGHELIGLENDQEYFFVVTVTCGGDESPPSVEVTATPRASPPLVSDRYRLQDMPEGTVEDVVTGLQWMRCSLGQRWDGVTCVGYADGHTYQSALQAAELLNEADGYAGLGDWRVPTLSELQSLVYCSSGVPALFKGDDPSICQGSHDIPTLDREVFPANSAEDGWFWSATPESRDGCQAWGVDFTRGDSHAYPGTVRSVVRLVRQPKVKD